MTEALSLEPEVLKLYDGTEVKLFWDRLAEDRKKYGSAGYGKPNIKFGIGICKQCGRIFIKSYYHQKFCTWTCKMNAEKKKRRESRPLSPYQLDFVFNYFVVHNKLNPEKFKEMLERTKRRFERRLRRNKDRKSFLPPRQYMLLQTIERKFKDWLEQQQKKKQG